MRFGPESKEEWHLWYAWRPVKAMNGQWVWLEEVERCSYFARHVPVCAPNSVCGWVFRPLTAAYHLEQKE
jgi:hypothetical protein